MWFGILTGGLIVSQLMLFIKFGGTNHWTSEPGNALHVSNNSNIRYQLVPEWTLISPLDWCSGYGYIVYQNLLITFVHHQHMV